MILMGVSSEKEEIDCLWAHSTYKSYPQTQQAFRSLLFLAMILACDLIRL
jgi:hypothetical protein